MPTVTGTANHWRPYDDWSRCDHNGGTRHDHGCIRPTSAIRSAVKADTTSARSIGGVDRDKRK